MIWFSVKLRLPESGKKVLATYRNSLGKHRIIVGHFIKRWTIESDCEDDSYDEYNEEKDKYFLREGWYEQQDNWGEYASIFVNEGEVTHWMSLPKPPIEQEQP